MPVKKGLGYPIQDPYPVNSVELSQIPKLQDATKKREKGKAKAKYINPNLTPIVMSSK
jgi:hypothetical protein